MTGKSPRTPRAAGQKASKVLIQQKPETAKVFIYGASVRHTMKAKAI